MADGRLNAKGKRSIVIAITGASGVVYGTELLKALKEDSSCEVHLIVSENAMPLIEYETNLKVEDVYGLADHWYKNDDLAASIASGSVMFDSMVIVPASMSTLGKLSVGIGDNLVTRVAAVALKERRKLVLVPRETPMSTIHLENMAKLSLHGAVLLPAMPGFYNKPSTLKELVDFIVGKILDQLGVDNTTYKRWGE